MKIYLNKEFLRNYLFEKRLTIKEFSNESGISLATMYASISKKHELSVNTRKKLINYFNRKDIFDMVYAPTEE